MNRILLLGCVCSALLSCGGGNKATSDAASGPDASIDAPQITGTKYSLTWGSVDDPAGANSEHTQCVILRLGNADEIKVHQIHNTLSTASHHVIVYKDDMDTVEQTTPVDCQPFSGALNPTGMIAPMMITQKKDDLLTLPDGVAYTLAANQMVRIEMHYINSTDGDLTATESTDFYAADPATIQNEANILFIGSPDIGPADGSGNFTGIPAGQMYSLHEFFTPPATSGFLAGNFFAITGHEHHIGTDVVVKTGTSATDTNMSTVYDPTTFLWSEPETTVHNPTFQIPSGGGFDFTCSWNNTTSATEKFGESANDEMCFFWAYYYPSAGSHVCVHTDYKGLQLNVCCPAAPGDALSMNVCNQLATSF